MNVMKNLLLVLLIISGFGLQAQKVKGSRNVITEQTRLKYFTSVEIQGEFEVGLLKGQDAMMEVRADDNLHSVIQAEISNEVLYIKPTKNIKRAKSLEINITFPETIKRIVISDDVELESLQDLYLEDAELRVNDKAKAWLTLTAQNFKFYNSEKAKVEMNLTADEAYFQLNKRSELEALVNAPVFKVDSYEKASAKIEGEIEKFTLRAEHKTKFDGKNLTAKNASIIAEGRSKNEIEVSKNLEITGKDRAEIEVYGNPKIEMLEFTENAQLSKKEK